MFVLHKSKMRIAQVLHCSHSIRIKCLSQGFNVQLWLTDIAQRAIVINPLISSVPGKAVINSLAHVGKYSITLYYINQSQ